MRYVSEPLHMLYVLYSVYIIRRGIINILKGLVGSEANNKLSMKKVFPSIPISVNVISLSKASCC